MEAHDASRRCLDPCQRTVVASAVAGAVSLSAVSVVVMAQASGIVAAVGICGVVFFTSASVGAAIGFLFALPKVLTKNGTQNPPAPHDGAAKPGTPPSDGSRPATGRLLGSNTNLERVSDWLTTMIVGVALTQLRSINGALYGFRRFLEDTAKVFPDGKGGNAGVLPTVGPMVLVLGATLGFLLSYLYTRLIISVAMNVVEDVLAKPQPLPAEAAQEVRVLAKSLPGATENVTFASIVSGAEPSMYEGIELMGSLLYQEGRYQDVLDLAGKLSITQARQLPEYWLYQAAAFGQKYHGLIQQQAPVADRDAARDNAFDCARRAVRIDPGMKARLWAISDPNGVDDDLADFRSNEEFLRIVGRSRSA